MSLTRSDTTVGDFKNFGYVVVKNMISPNEAKRLYDYTLNRLAHGNMDDGQVPGSPSFYQDREMIAQQNILTAKIEEYTQIKLIPMFCYNRVYRTGAILRMHKDSERAQIGATINLGQKGNPWDIWLVDYNENAHNITLEPGDALIYYGSKLHHWRGQLVDSDLVSQVMFHFNAYSIKSMITAKMEIFLKIRKRCRELLGIS
jgi:hypothetical protein